MSIRTNTPPHVGTLRNKVSANLADDEYALVTKQAQTHVPPLSPSGLMRQAWLDWSFDRGDIVSANEPAIKSLPAKKKAKGGK